MSKHEHPPWRAQRPHVYEIEFACRPFTESHYAGLEPAHATPSLSADDQKLADERHQSIRARLLDPRLQRIIAAAANGWVVERLR